MRTIRIYQPGDYQVGQTLALSETAAQHVGVVLRLSIGTKITLFRGDHYEFAATLSSIHKKQIQVTIDAMEEINRESPRTIHLAQGLAKGDKMEWIIQKAVELGVTSITPLFTERCVVRLDAQRLAKKHQQWQAIAIAACEQSGRNHLPYIHAACSFEHYLKQCATPYQWILSPTAEQSWPQLSKEETSAITLLIGPEGGFSPQELSLAQQHHVQSVRLGPRILRTETAAIAALSILQMRYGDLS